MSSKDFHERSPSTCAIRGELRSGRANPIKMANNSAAIFDGIVRLVFATILSPLRDLFCLAHFASQICLVTSWLADAWFSPSPGRVVKAQKTATFAQRV